MPGMVCDKKQTASLSQIEEADKGHCEDILSRMFYIGFV